METRKTIAKNLGKYKHNEKDSFFSLKKQTQEAKTKSRQCQSTPEPFGMFVKL